MSDRKSDDQAPPQIFGRGAAILQKRRPRAGSWTKQQCTTFFDTLAATCNIRLACRTIGGSAASAYAMQRRDPAFAERWRIAIAEGYDRIEAELLSRALGAGDGDDIDAGRVPSVPFDPVLAMKMLKRRDAPAPRGVSASGGRRRYRTVTIEEVEARLMTILDKLDRRAKKRP